MDDSVQRIRGIALAIGVVVATACSGGSTEQPDSRAAATGTGVSATVPGTGVSGSEGTGDVSSTPPSSTTTSTVVVDLSRRPLVFFQPLPPLPGNSGLPFRDGSIDFFDLFADGSPWERAAGHVDVFGLYGTYIRHYSTDDQLRAIIDGLRARGIGLAIELGPLTTPDPADCVGREGFGGADEIELLHRIADLGGTVDIVSLDEPFAFGHRADGPDDCQWPVDRVATQIADFVGLARAVFPDLAIGATEPLWASPSVGPGDVAEWVDAYEVAVGEPLAFLHLDVEWERPDWLANAVAVREQLAERGIPTGLVGNGGEADDDRTWITDAASRISQFENAISAPLEDVVFQSWFDRPDRTLPENDPTTFTGMIERYFGPRLSIELAALDGAVTGTVRTADGAAIADVDVAITVTPPDGTAGTTTLTGTVPANATQAVGIFRVNGEGPPGVADVDVSIDAASYREGGDNLLPNAGFDREGQWGGYGAGSSTFARLGDATVLRLEAMPDEVLFVDSVPFAVTPGAPFLYQITAIVPSAASGAVFAGLAFLDRDEVARVGVVLEPGSLGAMAATTDVAGGFRISLPPGTTGMAHVDASVDDPAFWPATEAALLEF
jgi:hypothetical protein